MRSVDAGSSGRRWRRPAPGRSTRAPVARLLAQARVQTARPAGELLGTLPLTGDRRGETPFGESVGGPGLDTRVFTDLSRLTPDRLITPSNQVFVRTAVPPGVKAALPTWAVTLTGPGGHARWASPTPPCGPTDGRTSDRVLRATPIRTTSA